MKMKIKLLDPRLSDALPGYATDGAAAIDLRACRIDEKEITGSTVIPAGGTLMVGTGISVHLGSISTYGDTNISVASLILPRSGMGAKHGIVIGNLVGLIDSDYQGELIACVWNRSGEPFAFSPLDRVAQMIIVPVLKPAFEVVSEFGEQSARGAGGFGSTGRN